MSDKIYPALGVLDKWPLKQYRGVLVGTVIEEDSRYVNWAVEKEIITLTDEATAYLEEWL